MASSLFARKPVPRKLPPICKSKAPPGIPPVLILIPRSLQGFAVWSDLPPPGNGKVDSYLTLAKVHPAPMYQGQTSLLLPYIVADVQPSGAPELWQVRLWLYWPGEIPEEFIFPLVHVDPNAPFDTGLLTDTVNPGIDYRLARFME
ncbi:MAG: hypothetical protein V3V75_06665 [Thermoguttaceae bacterium]